MKVTEWHVMNRSVMTGKDGCKYRRSLLLQGGKDMLCIQRKVPGVRGWKVVIYNFPWSEARGKTPAVRRWRGAGILADESARWLCGGTFLGNRLTRAAPIEGGHNQTGGIMRGPMKLIDASSGLTECGVCGSCHHASLQSGSLRADGITNHPRGSWQCSDEQCPSNEKTRDVAKQHFVKPNWRELAVAA